MNQAIGKYRWTICSLVFFATTVNYLDRAVISLLKPYIAEDFKWDKVAEAANYANIEIAFKVVEARKVPKKVQIRILRNKKKRILNSIRKRIRTTVLILILFPVLTEIQNL